MTDCSSAGDVWPRQRGLQVFVIERDMQAGISACLSASAVNLLLL